MDNQYLSKDVGTQKANSLQVCSLHRNNSKQLHDTKQNTGITKKCNYVKENDEEQSELHPQSLKQTSY